MEGPERHDRDGCVDSGAISRTGDHDGPLGVEDRDDGTMSSIHLSPSRQTVRLFPALVLFDLAPSRSTWGQETPSCDLLHGSAPFSARARLK